MKTDSSSQKPLPEEGEDMKLFEQTLRREGLRVTPERRAVYSVLLTNGSRGLTAAQTGELVASSEGLNIERATVYNCLRAFMKLGLVRRKTLTGSHGTGAASAIYTAVDPAELKDGNTVLSKKLTLDLALSCTVCGKVKVARDSELANYLRRHRFTGYDTAGGTAEVRISCVCNRCMRSLADKNPASTTEKRNNQSIISHTLKRKK